MSLISSQDLSITDCFCLLQWTNFVRTYITVLYVVEKIKLYTHMPLRTAQNSPQDYFY